MAWLSETLARRGKIRHHTGLMVSVVKKIGWNIPPSIASSPNVNREGYPQFAELSTFSETPSRLFSTFRALEFTAIPPPMGARRTTVLQYRHLYLVPLPQFHRPRILYGAQRQQSQPLTSEIADPLAHQWSSIPLRPWDARFRW
ncbi:hypothetical protein VTK73DRAFT_3608 [Phialemonium thermophilum]|uniref:Uncharacterized protein n=1 Tax=Phialemonium thermophilum TaxID=223376 RepID=A0ABR3WYI6_9PEZI